MYKFARDTFKCTNSESGVTDIDLSMEPYEVVDFRDNNGDENDDVLVDLFRLTCRKRNQCDSTTLIIKSDWSASNPLDLTKFECGGKP